MLTGAANFEMFFGCNLNIHDGVHQLFLPSMLLEHQGEIMEGLPWSFPNL